MANTRKGQRTEITIQVPSTTLTAIFKNNKFGTSRNGRIFLRNGYRKAIKEFAEAIRIGVPHAEAVYFASICPVAVEIEWGRKKGMAVVRIALTGQNKDGELGEKRADVDAPVSGILDALQLSGVICNDKYVDKIICKKK